MKHQLRIAAVAFLVLSVLIYLWVSLTSDAFLPWVGGHMALPMIAITLVPIVFAFTGDSILSALTGNNSSEFRDGLMGIGTVEGISHTGVTLNDQPQVRIDFRVEGVDGKVFASHAKMIVPITQLALLRPGVVLPVRYLPERTDRVEVDLSGDTAAAQEAMNAAMIRKGFTTPEKLDIARRGIATQGVVRSLSVPGEIRDGHSRLDLTLIVTRPDGSTFEARTEKFLPPTAVSQVQVGRVVGVHYLPGNEQEVVLSLPMNASTA
ncbi:hypothetical protein [Nocardia huaxiensis]|uniref:Uncharacterized protein n=1 Tax=Nocardia huaxiensis TaxID=2755382 RepID=A0A7D6ZDR6_9NOCA|nr:hypothetical protein [Nocardia huaxiensis]QLY33108.1 hypothetical protein H0264_13515 [Nocardia huaxiensis]UFS93122.1 phage GP46 family protein [Nocardia huaxiensis]